MAVADIELVPGARLLHGIGRLERDRRILAYGIAGAQVAQLIFELLVCGIGLVEGFGFRDPGGVRPPLAGPT